MLEVATRGTIYSDLIQLYKKQKDGRSTFLTRVSQHAGEDKWDSILKFQTKIMVTRRWKVRNSNHPLELFVQQHRAAFAAMQSCVVHVDFQLPNDYNRVGYPLDAIECNDAALLAVITKVEEENTSQGKQNNLNYVQLTFSPKTLLSRNAFFMQRAPQVRFRELTVEPRRGTASVSPAFIFDTINRRSLAGLPKTSVRNYCLTARTMVLAGATEEAAVAVNDVKEAALAT